MLKFLERTTQQTEDTKGSNSCTALFARYVYQIDTMDNGYVYSNKSCCEKTCQEWRTKVCVCWWYFSRSCGPAKFKGTFKNIGFPMSKYTVMTFRILQNNRYSKFLVKASLTLLWNATQENTTVHSRRLWRSWFISREGRGKPESINRSMLLP